MVRREEKIVSIVWDVIKRFIKNWQKSPYEWETEMDIQAEIYSRLARRFKLDKILKQKLKYDDVIKQFRNRPQTYRRVYCAPQTYYKTKSGKIEKCKPDIVIYRGDVDNPPPDNKKRINFPMLLVCELKYETDWSGDSLPENKRHDIYKMESLVKQRGNKIINGTEYACCLRFYRQKTESNHGESLKPKQEKIDGRLKIYDIMIP